MVPAAPATFSITTGCFRISPSLGATMRAAESTPPPAENGTINVIGFDGHACADTDDANASDTSVATSVTTGFDAWNIRPPDGRAWHLPATSVLVITSHDKRHPRQVAAGRGSDRAAGDVPRPRPRNAAQGHPRRSAEGPPAASLRDRADRAVRRQPDHRPAGARRPEAAGSRRQAAGERHVRRAAGAGERELRRRRGTFGGNRGKRKGHPESPPGTLRRSRTRSRCS